MSKNIILLILLLPLISISTIGQEIKLEDLCVGFTCGISAKTTPLVNKIADLTRDKKHSEISKLLYTKNSGEIYLAIIVLERLVKNKLYQFDEREKLFISRIKSSNMIVYNCLGCFSDTNSMNEMFLKENLIGEIEWLNKILPFE